MAQSIYIFGMGPVGSSLAISIAEAGLEVIGACETHEERARIAKAQTGIDADRTLDPQRVSRAGVVIASVGDRHVEALAEEAAEKGGYASGQSWLHCSGALSADALSPLRGLVAGLGSAHPAMVFPPGTCRRIPDGTKFALDGNECALTVAASLVRAIGGVPVEVPSDARAAYHAALVFSSNYLVVLMDLAKELLVERGVDPGQAEGLVTSLAASAVGVAGEDGIRSSLSGPVRRKDTSAVELHLRALAGNPRLSNLYVVLARETARIVANADDIGSEDLGEILSLLDDAGKLEA